MRLTRDNTKSYSPRANINTEWFINSLLIEFNFILCPQNLADYNHYLVPIRCSITTADATSFWRSYSPIISLSYYSVLNDLVKKYSWLILLVTGEFPLIR